MVLGGYVSAFVGAAVMTPVAYLVARSPSAMPARASFLPGFWLLVPGALGLIGITQYAGEVTAVGTDQLVATVASIFAVAIGVLAGTQLLTAAAGDALLAHATPTSRCFRARGASATAGDVTARHASVRHRRSAGGAPGTSTLRRRRCTRA